MAKLSAKEKENALNEVRILASIKHPNICSYKEAFFEDATMSLCIVMEYCDNGDLQTKINNAKKTSKFTKEDDVGLDGSAARHRIVCDDFALVKRNFLVAYCDLLSLEDRLLPSVHALAV